MERNRVTVQEAARILGVKEPAIRKRVKRGTLQSEREGGRVYVYLDTEESAGSYEERSGGRDELVEELRDRVRALEEANRENRRIIAALTSRIPEVEAPSEARESPLGSSEEPFSTSPPSEQEEPTSRPWWRRVFGG